MLPDSQRGFAPTIRGVAHSNARVSVRQHGYTIYETYVAPGAFVISDLFPTSQSGDLEITVHESDGSERTFTQPYSSVAFMLREKRLKFSASAGRYNSPDAEGDTPPFVQASAFYGLSSSLTLYGGAELSGHYQALALGLGKDFGRFGALGVDTVAAKAHLSDDRLALGQQIRAQYQKISLRRTRRSPFRPAITRRMTFTVSVKQMMTATQTSTCITGVTAHSSV